MQPTERLSCRRGDSGNAEHFGGALVVVLLEICFAGKELFRILFGIGISGIHHVKGVGFGQSLDGKCADVSIVGNHGSVQKADADPVRNQCFDGNKTADGDLSVEIAEFVAGCHQGLSARPQPRAVPGSG